MSEKKEVQKTSLCSAFAPVELPPQQCNDPVSEEDIVETLIVEGFEQDAEGNIKPVTKQIVTGKKNRKAYIESFSDEVGLENILEKIGQGAVAEDKYSILKTNPTGQVTDLRGFQKVQNMADIQSLADNARAAYARLDPALKKNMSFAEFCTSFKNQDLVDYVKAKQEALVKKNAKKEGDNQ